MKLRAHITLLAMTLALPAAAVACGPTPDGPAADEPAGSSSDARQRLTMPAASRDLVLQEMRHMLEAVDGILDGVAADDMQAVARAAREGGTDNAVDLAPGVAGRLPQEFKQLGMRTHRAFDDLAARARQGASGEEIIADLGDLTGNCVGCHVAYRLDQER